MLSQEMIVTTLFFLKYLMCCSCVILLSYMSHCVTQYFHHYYHAYAIVESQEQSYVCFSELPDTSVLHVHKNIITVCYKLWCVDVILETFLFTQFTIEKVRRHQKAPTFLCVCMTLTPYLRKFQFSLSVSTLTNMKMKISNKINPYQKFDVI